MALLGRRRLGPLIVGNALADGFGRLSNHLVYSLRLRQHGDMARRQFGDLRVHPLGDEALKVRIHGPVVGTDDIVGRFRPPSGARTVVGCDQTAECDRETHPANVARSILARIIVPFLEAYPEIRLEITAEDSFVDLLAAGADAGIRYDERLEQDMIAVPIGPRIQRFAAAASPSYLAARGRPEHPRDLLNHNCLRTRFAGGSVVPFEFEKEGEIIQVDPPGQLIVRPGAAGELLLSCAVAGLGIINSFDDLLTPFFESGALEPVLESWWESFPGPFLYYPGRRHIPAPLRAFVDFVKKESRTC